MKTVHLIGNAHLDPVWRWPWAAGADAAVATARSACDLLDEFSEFVFTASGSWFHQAVGDRDAALLDRIARHVAAGRWRLVGGMVVEPDCNIPSAESFARQLAVGQGYFRRTFGQTATVGFNIDSFGHTAYLPRILVEGGIDSYVFMRPGPHEMDLPAGPFRWRSPDGAEVLAFRIAGAYTTGAEDLARHVAAAVEASGDADETMCFFGVGDHGGGPTRKQIRWILDHRDTIDGVRLLFSHPRAYFDAVAAAAGSAPVVEGELQHHAIGCYAVERRIKVAMRRAEARLGQADRATDAAGAAAERAELDPAWEAVLRNQFHDILGGTSIDAAGRAAAGQCLAAEARADEVLSRLTRRAFRARAIPGVHQVVVCNPGPDPFEGLIAHEPWLVGSPAFDVAVTDEQGQPVPHQIVAPEALVGWNTAILLPASVPAGGSAVYRLVPAAGAGPAESADALCADAGGLADGAFRVGCGPDGLSVAGWTIGLAVHDDPSDTWSHGCGNRFGQSLAGAFAFAGPWEAVEQGPIRAAIRAPAAFDRSSLWCRAAVVAGEKMLRLHLSVIWAQARQRLCLRIVGPAPLTGRTDLVSGGPLERAIDGREYPLSGGTVVTAKGGSALAVVAPEVFSLSADAGGLSLTLLRSPLLCHHDPLPAEDRPDGPLADQGRHEFDLILAPGAALDPAAVARLARQMLAGPIVFDLTG